MIADLIVVYQLNKSFPLIPMHIKWNLHQFQVKNNKALQGNPNIQNDDKKINNKFLTNGNKGTFQKYWRSQITFRQRAGPSLLQDPNAMFLETAC